MGKLLSGLVGVVGALWLGLAGAAGAEWWEHRALGQPAALNLHVFWWRWSPPPSLAAQRDAALRRLGLAQAGEATLENAIADQNAAIEARVAAGARALASASAEVELYRASAASTAGRLAIIDAPLAGGDVCDRVLGADARLLESLR